MRKLGDFLEVVLDCWDDLTPYQEDFRLELKEVDVCMDRHPRFLKDAIYRLIATVERYHHHDADLESDIDQMRARLEMAFECLEGDDEGDDE